MKMLELFYLFVKFESLMYTNKAIHLHAHWFGCEQDEW